MKFLDLFAGIGGFRLGMEAAGHECIGFCEKDKFARASYKSIFNTEGEIEIHDITTVSNQFIQSIGHVDIICGGFPCQAFSIAGSRKGFGDTRGTLFFEIARFTSILKPNILFLENVKGLLNHNNGETFQVILNTLDGLGYNVEWQLLNSKHFGVPKNRERVFIIGHLRNGSRRKIFPIGKTIENINGGIDDGLQIKRYGTLQPNFNQDGVIYDTEGIAPTIRAYQGGNSEPKIRIKEATKKGYSEASIGDSVNLSHPNSKTRRGRVGKGIANTLLTSDEQCVVDTNYRIRKLTPKECWRLQGFPDWAFERAAKVNSNSQLYRQAGNSVTVNVIEAIAKELN